MPDPLANLDDPSPSPRRRSSCVVFWLVGVVAALLLIAGAVSVLAWVLAGKPLPPASLLHFGPPAADLSTAPTDPWPECAAIRAYMRVHTADPASFEVAIWKSRQTDKLGTHINVDYRCKNRFGALALHQGYFLVTAGVVVLFTNEEDIPRLPSP